MLPPVPRTGVSRLYAEPVKVLLFGATGMVGAGVLRECLLAPDVEHVRAVGRTPTGRQAPKLDEVVHADLADLTPIEDRLAGYDACFFCLGVSSRGMSEPDYRRITYDLTMAAARPLARLNPDITFIYVSGAGANRDSRTMWARVKGVTEDAVIHLLPNGYAMRPAYIQPRHGVTSKTRLYSLFYTVGAPLYPVLRTLFPRYVTTTEQLGHAMLGVARHGSGTRILETPDINAVTS
jgi:uncharacterized protein YbjT (DUF2867 family)